MHPSYPDSEILEHPVNPYQGRRHTHEAVRTVVSASQSRSSIGSSNRSPEPEKQAPLHEAENTVKKADEEIEDRRPSFAEIQSEDRVRRPSVTLYQMEDSDHPDIKSIQAMVAHMTFGETV